MVQLTPEKPVTNIPKVLMPKATTDLDHLITTFKQFATPFRKNYTIQKTLSENVYLCKKKQKLVVMKKINTQTERGRRVVTREILAGIRLKHSNVSNFLEKFEDDDGKTCLVFDYICGQDLLQLMETRKFRPLDEETAKRYVSQMVQTLLYCHQSGIGHLDVKLENFMIDKELQKITLIDFGLSEVNNPLECESWVGSNDYYPPEIISKKKFCAFQADVFSLGVVLFILLHGELPWNYEEKIAHLKLFQKFPPLQWSNPDVSTEAKDLLLQMMNMVPSERITLSAMQNHPWFTNSQSHPH